MAAAAGMGAAATATATAVVVMGAVAAGGWRHLYIGAARVDLGAGVEVQDEQIDADIRFGERLKVDLGASTGDHAHDHVRCAPVHAPQVRERLGERGMGG